MTIVDLLERLVGGGTISPLAPVLGPEQKTWPCHPLFSIVHDGQYDTNYGASHIISPLRPTCMEVSTKLHGSKLTSIEISMEVDGSGFTSIEYMELSTVGRSQIFHWFNQLQLPRIYSVEAFMRFYIPLHTSIYFHEYHKLPAASTT